VGRRGRTRSGLLGPLATISTAAGAGLAGTGTTGAIAPWTRSPTGGQRGPESDCHTVRRRTTFLISCTIYTTLEIFSSKYG